MKTDEIQDLLESRQTGEYIPTQEEAAELDNLQDIKTQAGPGPVFNNFRLRRDGSTMRNENVGLEAAAEGWGTSRFDRGEFVPGQDTEHKRALEQSSFSKILNGAIKGGIVAGTTAVETTAGIIDGLFEGIAAFGKEAGDDESGIDMSKVIGSAVNNTVARTMIDIQRKADEWFPNYRTQEERSDKYQDEWYKHIFTANFIGDAFLKNFGFTVGALAGGAVWSKALSAGLRAATAGNLMKGVVAAAEGNKEAEAALRTAQGLVSNSAVGVLDEAAITKNIVDASKVLNKMSTTQQLFGGVIAAMGEGTMEGIMARDEFSDRQINKLNQEYISKVNGLEQEILNSGNPDYVVYNLIGVSPDNRPQYSRSLSEEGRRKLAEERQKLDEQYSASKEYLNDLGDRIAATTFLLNLPVLTVSNVMQYGKMLSGGFKTTRNAASKVAGQAMMRNGELVAEYTGKGSVAARAVSKSLRNGITEASEEMAQGFVSSGAKNVADASLAAFNNDGYDTEAMKEYGSWISNMLDGGMEYLKDGRNWQEGFLGMLTGLVGIPGRPWNGGVIGAAGEARAEAQDSQAAADALNSLINTDKFQNAWKGYVRHMKYETEMGDAVEADDKYSWKTANDKQLISDIITFADAGKLQDLKDIVDGYAALTEADELNAVSEASTPGSDAEAINNPSGKIRSIKEQAEEIKKAIDTYNDMYNAMTTLAPIGTSPAQIKEMIATSMNIKAFETRFLSMFGDVINKLERFVEPLAMIRPDGTEETDDRAKVSRARQIYDALAQVYTGGSVSTNLTLDEAIGTYRALRDLETVVDKTADETLKEELADMKKVASDRKAFVKKLLTLKDMPSEKFEEKAKSPDDVIKEQKQEKAKQETDGLNTLDEVKQAYFSKDANGKADILSSFEAVEDSNENVKKFMDIKRRYDDFYNYLNEHPAVSVEDPTVTPPMIQSMLNDAYHRAQSVDDLANLPDNVFRSRSAFNMDFQSPFGPMSPTAYDSVKKILRESMRAFMGIETATATRNTINPEQTEPVPANPTSTPTGYDAAQPGSLEPVPQASGNPERESTTIQKTPQPVAQEYITPTDATDEQLVYDAADVAFEDDGDTILEVVSREDKDGKDVRLRTSVPEIDSGEAKLAREALASGRDKDAYKEADLSDFVLKHPEYADIWNALKQNGAFDYVSTELSAGDEIEFIVDPTFPTYNGKYQILIAVKNGDRHQILTVLSNQESKYYGLSELRRAINSEYQSFREAHPNDIFVFSKKSRVFYKQPGLIDYGSREDEKGIVDIPAYDETAPIVFINKQGKAVTVRGYDSDAASKVSSKFVNADRNMGKINGIDRRGNLYYLAQSGAGRYIPIRLNVEHFKKENKDADNPVFNSIRKSLDAITNIVRESNSANLDAQNKKLRAELTNLVGNLDIHKFYFEIGNFENVGTALRIKKGETSVLRRPDQITEEWLTDYIAGQNLSVQLKMDKNDKLKNFSQLIGSGIITSNARMLRAKGVDFYAYPWRNETKNFGPVTPEQAELQRGIDEEQNERGVSETHFMDEAFDDRGESGDFVNDEDIDIRLKPLVKDVVYYKRSSNNTSNSSIIKENEDHYDFMIRSLKHIQKKYRSVVQKYAFFNGDKLTFSGEYDVEKDLIRIFAKAGKTYEDYENTYFHENLHAFLTKNGINDDSPVLTKFIDFARNYTSGIEDMENFVRSNDEYKGIENEELFVILVSSLLTQGLVSDIQALAPKESVNVINDYIKAIGYEPGKERAQRLDVGMELIREENSDESENDSVRDRSSSQPTGRKKEELTFEAQTQSVKQQILGKGYSKEEFDSMPDILKDRVLKCLGA